MPMHGESNENIQAVESAGAGEGRHAALGKDITNENNLDFTEDSAISNYDQPSPHVGNDYDPRPQEDNARRIIAYMLIGLLWFIVLGIFLLLGFDKINIEDIKDFGVVLSPIIALVSAATGFYYGTKDNSSNGK